MNKIFNLLFGLSVKKYVSNEGREDNQQYSKEDLIRTLNRLYKCRDLEISNLWQRSAFLSVFMVLCFSGYGYLLLQIIETQPCNCGPLNKIAYLNIAAIALGCLSCIFSLLWIFMAKSSKAWYEVYETAISTFENEHRESLKIPKFNVMGEMGLHIQKMSSCIYSAKAGAYSPSRINIAIGQVCFTIWFLSVILHFIFLAQIPNSIICLPITIVVITVLLVLVLMCSGWIKSGHLSEYIYNKKGQYVE